MGSRVSLCIALASCIQLAYSVSLKSNAPMVQHADPLLLRAARGEVQIFNTILTK